jgi:hypothetical protein
MAQQDKGVVVSHRQSFRPVEMEEVVGSGIRSAKRTLKRGRRTANALQSQVPHTKITSNVVNDLFLEEICFAL